MGPAWRRFRFHGDALVDDAGIHYFEDEIATISLLHQRIAALEAEVDRMRYNQDVAGIGFFELETSPKKVISEGQALLETVKKVPKRRIRTKRHNLGSATATGIQLRPDPR